MIEHVGKVKGFKAVPYLEKSAIMKAHPAGISFSQDKPNVIVGPNGSGKSALMTALAMRSLSFYVGESSFDDNYVTSNDSKDFWTDTEPSWRHQYEFLSGLNCVTDDGPAIYYRPDHVPGNHVDGMHALMMGGYSDRANQYFRDAENKSSGQKSQSLLKKSVDLLSGKVTQLEYLYTNWHYGKTLKELDFGARHVASYERHAEHLKKQFGSVSPDAKPVLLMDEPELSLDARAEGHLWRQIEKADCSRMQVIVATHSWYPLMHPEAFTLIEAVPGYIKEVQAVIDPSLQAGA